MKAIIFILLLSACFAAAYTVSDNQYMTDGSQSDVQAACNDAPDDGTVTVIIPNGTHQWSGTFGITKALTLAGASATGVIIESHLATGTMLYVASSAHGHFNLYWLHFKQVVPNGGAANYILGTERTEPSNYTVLIHDCSFHSASYLIRCYSNGVIFWADTFTGGGGVDLTHGRYGPGTATGSPSNWNAPDTYGLEDSTGLVNTYMEDCLWQPYCGYLLNISDNARVVFRHNTVNDCSLGSHGQESAPFGARLFEIYNNTFTRSGAYTLQDWFDVRGGVGVIWGNVLPAIPNKRSIQFNVYSINIPGQIPCQTGYPAARQVGQGWSASSHEPFGHPVVESDGIGAAITGVWLWDNTGDGANNIGVNNSEDKCGHGQKATDYVHKDRDYFLRAKPDYTPYPYPHPLHTAFAIGGPGSTPTPAPTATPTPQPTSTPTPTPQPTPPPAEGATYQQWLNDFSHWIETHPAHPDQ